MLCGKDLGFNDREDAMVNIVGMILACDDFLYNFVSHGCDVFVGYG